MKRKKPSHSQPLCDLAEQLERQSQLKEFRDSFATDPRGPYAIQHPDQSWSTRYKPVSDPLIKAHLGEKYWLAVRGMYYPLMYFLDFDGDESAWYRAKEYLKLRDGQYYMMTSPGFWRGEFRIHVALKLNYQGRLPTLKLGNQVLNNAVRNLCEVYPQDRRKFRVPLGKGQYLIDHDTMRVLSNLKWWEAFYFLKKLDPIDIETLPFQPAFTFPSEAKQEDNSRTWVPHSEAVELWRHGLQAKASRHKAQWTLAVWHYRLNYTPAQAIEKIEWWLRRRHNGFSQSVNAGDWDEIGAEIRRQVYWIWENFRVYPDGPHNLERAITKADLTLAATIYRGDVVNQKRFLKLASFVRPRCYYDWVFIPYHVWRGVSDGSDGRSASGIAHKSNYKAFIADLESKGLIECDWTYKHVDGRPNESYPRKFRLKLPKTHEDPIRRDNRNITDYHGVLQTVFRSVSDIVDFTGIAKQRVYELLRRETGIK